MLDGLHNDDRTDKMDTDMTGRLDVARLARLPESRTTPSDYHQVT